MSLDVWLRCPTCESPREEFNYTHNLTPMWQAGLDAIGIPNESLGSWLEKCRDKKMVAGDIKPTLYRLLEWTCAVDLSKYDAANGWGTGKGAQEFLAGIINACAAHPEFRVEVWR